MWLLDKMLRQLIRNGRLIVTDYDGKTHEYGDPGADPLSIRFTDRGTALHIAKNPRMGAGEAYTDGRLVVEPPHDVRDFVLFVMNQANREDGALNPKGIARQLIDKAGSKLDQINLRGRASSMVLSPISASATTAVEVSRVSSMGGCLGQPARQIKHVTRLGHEVLARIDKQRFAAFQPALRQEQRRLCQFLRRGNPGEQVHLS